MKCASTSSVDSSMGSQRCSLKLRFLTLVVNTGDLINERATYTFTVSHALVAPVALATTFVMIGVFLLGGMRHYYGSKFLQVYGLVACGALQGALALSVLKELRRYSATTAFVLNCVLPLLIILLLLADLVVVMFSNREIPAPPMNSVEGSRLEINAS